MSEQILVREQRLTITWIHNPRYTVTKESFVEYRRCWICRKPLEIGQSVTACGTKEEGCKLVHQDCFENQKMVLT